MWLALYVHSLDDLLENTECNNAWLVDGWLYIMCKLPSDMVYHCYNCASQALMWIVQMGLHVLLDFDYFLCTSK